MNKYKYQMLSPWGKLLCLTGIHKNKRIGELRKRIGDNGYDVVCRRCGTVGFEIRGTSSPGPM